MPAFGPARDILRAMPTPAERRALLFLSGLVLLGAGVRTLSARSSAPEPLTTADSLALQGQLQAVDSARKQSKKPRKARSKKTADPKPGVAPGSGVSVGDPSRPRPIYLSEPQPQPEPGARARGRGGEPLRVDLDVASAAELERLPRIGPVLARRIVADRDSLGPFGSLEEFRRVKGVGRALVRVVSPYVTFSLQPRPPLVDTESGKRPAHRRTRRPPGDRNP